MMVSMSDVMGFDVDPFKMEMNINQELGSLSIPACDRKLSTSDEKDLCEVMEKLQIKVKSGLERILTALALQA